MGDQQAGPPVDRAQSYKWIAGLRHAIAVLSQDAAGYASREQLIGIRAGSYITIANQANDRFGFTIALILANPET